MITDKGFCHAIAKAVLEDIPDNEAALKILRELPEKRLVLNDGKVIDLSKTSESQARITENKRFMARIKRRKGGNI